MRGQPLVLLFAFLSLTWTAPSLRAQDPPATDVYLATLVETDAGLELQDVRNLTDRDGYDNQPAFSPDGETLYYTSIRASAEESEGESEEKSEEESEEGTPPQADIFAVDLATGRHRAVTSTPESEYSPTPIPATYRPGDPALSVVRVEADGTQRLWRVPLSGESEPTPILETIRPVGYHAWLPDGETLLLFVLDEPHRLVLASAAEPRGEGRTLTREIGRSFHAIPGEDAFSFVWQAPPEGHEGWWISRVDPQAGSEGRDGARLTPLFPTLEGREDLTWSPDGSVWMADGAVLFRRALDDALDDTLDDEGWQRVADLGEMASGEISRLAISPEGDRLAFVVSR